MDTVLLAVIVGIPLLWHVGLTAFVYWDTGRVPLERRKWTAITAAVPLFGFFMYLFERSELFYDPDEDPYRGHGINVHPSREDDVRPNRPRNDEDE
ncbi:hypothetical protein [Natrononativus amylolyticus]|uniref:hypothetical protein n=1 Tax=Natrononativus amylolyticus TaxID=2963434 RepID=UPI0020CFE391|nr:hypothetical protein [Natrononativus amylolyticus]